MLVQVVEAGSVGERVLLREGGGQVGVADGVPARRGGGLALGQVVVRLGRRLGVLDGLLGLVRAFVVSS